MFYKITERFFIIIAYLLLGITVVVSWLFIGCMWAFIACAVFVEFVYKKVVGK